MTQSVDIRELNEKIEKQSAFVDALVMGMDKVIIGQKHWLNHYLSDYYRTDIFCSKVFPD